MNARLGPLWAMGKVLVALVVAIGMAVSVVGVSGARPATASPSPSTTTSSSTTTTVPAARLPLPVTTTVPFGPVYVTTTSAPVLTSPPADSSSQSGMVGNFIPSDGVPAGTPADGQYEIMYSTGGGLFASADVGRQATGMFTSWIFEGNVWTVHAALWLDHWALTFHVADALAGPAESLAATYQDDVVGPLGLVGIALMFCVFTAFWYCIRGRGTKGMGELAVSLLVLTITACAWAQPSTLLLGNNGVLGHVRDLSTGLAAITTSIAGGTSEGSVPACGRGGEAADDTCDDELQAPLLGNIHNAFVEVPYELLNWGQQLDNPAAPSPCYGTEQQILAEGPWGTSDTPRDMMDSAGCNDLASFNADPSPDRLIGAVLCLTAGLLLFVQALIIAGATMLAELSVLGLVVAFPFVIPCGLLPGGARGLLWAWVTRALKAMLVLVATCMTLSLMLVTVSSLITYMSGDPLFEIFIALNAVVIGAIIFRGRITKSLARMAGSAGQRLAGAGIGGTQGRRWLAPAVGGFGAAEVASHLYRARHLANTTKRVAGLRRQLSSGSGTSWPGPGQGRGGGGAGAVAASAGAAAAVAAGSGVGAGGGTAGAAGAAGGAAPGLSVPGLGPATSAAPSKRAAAVKAATKTAKKLVSVGVDVALAAATSGSSTVVRGAAKGAQAARKAARAGKASAAAVKAAQQRAGNLRGRLGAPSRYGLPGAAPRARTQAGATLTGAGTGATSPGSGPPPGPSSGAKPDGARPSAGGPGGWAP